MNNAAPINDSENDSVLSQNFADGVLTLTLNQPQKRNALSDALIADLHNAIESAGKPADDKTGDKPSDKKVASAAESAKVNHSQKTAHSLDGGNLNSESTVKPEEIRVIIIAAAGNVFCAGHNLREMLAKKGESEYRDLFTRCSELMLSIVRCPKPIIAQVRGMATAAGCQLVASCDIAVASENAQFATPGVNIGLFCSTPMVALSRKIGRAAAMQMLLTGVPINAEKAAAAGLVNEVVADDELENRTMEIAKLIAAKPTKIVAIGKEAFYRQAEMKLEDAYQYAGEVMTKNMQQPEAKTGIGNFLHRRK